jgi:ferrous iron transport protein A
MAEITFFLSNLPIGSKARVIDLNPDSPLKRRLLDLGLTRDTVVEAVQKSPAGDPIAYLVRGAVIALRSEDASDVLLSM